MPYDNTKVLAAVAERNDERKQAYMSDEATDHAPETKQQNIPLNMDEIVKMLFTLSDELTIKMLNSLFGKDFPLDATVVVESGELYRFNPTEQVVDRFRADMIININGERFHIEFQTENDGTMVIRMFEYGFIISIKEIKSYLRNTDNGIKMNYPKQYVIFVEQNEAISENELTMEVTLWDGDVKEYKIPILRYWNETADSLEAKHLEPLLPLQVFKIRKGLDSIARSKKSEAEKEELTKAKLREMIDIYKSVAEKIRDLTENKGRLTTYNAEQMLKSLQHFSAYLYHNYKGYIEIEKEAVQMSDAVWSFDKWRNEGRVEGRVEGKRETAYEMFMDGENISKIRKYSKLSDRELAEVFDTLPETVRNEYNLVMAEN